MFMSSLQGVEPDAYDRFTTCRTDVSLLHPCSVQEPAWRRTLAVRLRLRQYKESLTSLPMSSFLLRWTTRSFSLGDSIRPVPVARCL